MCRVLDLFLVTITLSLCFVNGVDDDRVERAPIKQTTMTHDYYSRWLVVCRWPKTHITESLVILFEKGMHQEFQIKTS